MDIHTDKPTPVRLKEMKAPLQKQAMELDRSLHWLIRKILSDYLKSKNSSVEIKNRNQ